MVKTKKNTNKKNSNKKNTKNNNEIEQNSKENEKDQDLYEFTNYFKSETQLDKITHKSNPAHILEAYKRLIYIYARGHVREGVELEDLIAEAQAGICEAIVDFNNPDTPTRRYNFKQACLYKIRQSAYQYCLRNANQIKTPYYIQRGCMHVGQIFKFMQNQSVAEDILKRPGPATEQEIIDFLYNEKERLPLKSKRFIRSQINKKVTKKEFEQIYSGIVNHELGSRHSYVKNNLSDVGKILHIKEKMWYTADRNNMKYNRVIELILMARQSQTDLDPSLYGYGGEQVEKRVFTKQIFDYGKKVCGEKEFQIFLENKCYDKTYEEISKQYKLKKSAVTDIIKTCTKILRKDELMQQLFIEME